MGVPGTGAGRGLTLRSRGAASAHAGLTQLQPAPTATPGSMKDRTQELRTVSPIPARRSPRALYISTWFRHATGAPTRGRREPCKPGGTPEPPWEFHPSDLLLVTDSSLSAPGLMARTWGFEELFGRSCLGAIGGLLWGFDGGMQNRDLFSARLSPSLHCPLEAEPLVSLPPPCPEFPSQPHPWARCGNEAAGWGWPLREPSLGAPHHLWLTSPVAPDPPWSL